MYRELGVLKAFSFCMENCSLCVAIKLYVEKYIFTVLSFINTVKCSRFYATNRMMSTTRWPTSDGLVSKHDCGPCCMMEGT